MDLLNNSNKKGYVHRGGLGFQSPFQKKKDYVIIIGIHSTSIYIPPSFQ
jgi:hypothetical protein